MDYKRDGLASSFLLGLISEVTPTEDERREEKRQMAQRVRETKDLGRYRGETEKGRGTERDRPRRTGGGVVLEDRDTETE